MEQLQIQSLNCRGLGNKSKRVDFFEKFREQNINIICLQDIHIDSKLESTMRTEWGKTSVICPFSSNSRGVAILFNDNFEYKIHRSIRDPEGNFILIDLQIGEIARITLVNIYGPNDDKPEFYLNIWRLIASFENESFIICGDWNLTLDQKMDTYNYKHINNPKSRNTVLDFIKEKELIDVWRSYHEDDKHYTWQKRTPVKMARLDFFLITEDIFSLFTGADIKPKYKSDHSPVSVYLNISNHERGKGYWKFNNSLIKDPEFIKLVKNNINEVKSQYAASPYSIDYIKLCPNNEIQFVINDQLFLETLLVQLRGKIISYSAKKKREYIQLEKLVEKRISEIDDIIKEDANKYGDYIDTLEYLNKQMEDVRNRKIEGLIIRSRVEWYEAGEKSTKFFLGLEKRNYVNKSIQELRVDESVITDPTRILATQKDFYQNLYKNKDNERSGVEQISNKIKIESINKLTSEEREAREGEITYQELLSALKKMKNNKSPGLDGFTVEFLKFFWSDIGHFLLRSINYAYANGQLSTTQRRGVITCIPKPGKTRTSLSNWRPISLLSVIYKLASSCIAERIKSILDKIINEDQKGFIPGRFIGESIRSVYDIMYETQRQNIPGILLLVDFEKAFDTVSWSFIEKTLDIFNFGNSIKNWVKLFQNDSETYIIQNGHLSSSFKLGRGCRQGDPISPYIFILCMEILAEAIRNNNKIKGIQIWNETFKINQFADDTSLLLDDSEQSLKEALNTFDWFYDISGLKINLEKTKVIWLGSMRESDRRFCKENNLSWVTTFTLLGVHFDVKDLNAITIQNLAPNIKKMQNLLNIWRQRNLTPFGKITVIKSLVLPKITHLLTSLPDPDKHTIENIQKMFTNFIWNNKPPKIKRKIMYQDYINGGLRMTNLNIYLNSLKLSWIRRFLTKDGKWKIFLEHYLPPDFFTMGSKCLLAIENINNPFWKSVLEAWAYFTDLANYKTNLDNIMNRPIWYNPEIKIEYIKSWHIKGITFIRDIYNSEGNIMSVEELKQTYNIHCTFIDHIRLVKAIPNYYHDTMKQNILSIFPRIPHAVKETISAPKGCKKFTQILSAGNIVDTPKSLNKWENEHLTIEVDFIGWNHIFTRIIQISTNPNIRYFQYKIVHRILTTNKFLKMIGILDMDTCTFCKEESETIKHIFVDCEITKPIWLQLHHWLKICGYTNLEVFSATDIILGIPSVDIVINLVIVIAKFVIYCARETNKRPSFVAVKSYIKHIMNTEKYIASTNNKLDKFYGKWSVLFDALDSI